MPIAVRVCTPDEITPLRACYRQEMDCQIVHDSLHARPGWSVEYALHRNDSIVGYGSVAVGGPWKNSHALYEFYVSEDSRQHIFDLFAAFLATAAVTKV